MLLDEHLIKIRFPYSSAPDVPVKFYVTYIITSNCFLSQLGYLLSNIYQLPVLMRTLRTHIMMLGGMNDKLASKISSGNESRAWKEKIMQWVFQTLAKDRD